MDGRRSRRRHAALYINAMVFDFWRIQPWPEAIDSTLGAQNATSCEVRAELCSRTPCKMIIDSDWEGVAEWLW